MTGEFYALFAAVVCGAAAVVVWNMAEAFKNVFGAKAVICGIFDILWWVSMCVLFCFCMWEILDLRIRAFEFFGVVIGAFLCHITLGVPSKYIFEGIFAIILKIFKFILKILLTPRAFLYKILYRGKTDRFHKKAGKVAYDEFLEEKID